MARLSKRMIDQEQPGAVERFVWDDELIGFGCRIYPSGAKVFLVQWKRDGRTRRKVLGRHGPVTCEQARKLALNDLAAVARGEDPAAERDRRKLDLTVAELCTSWVEAGCPRARPDRRSGAFLKVATIKTYTSAIERHIKPLLGDRKLGTLRPADIERFQADVAAGRTALTARTKARGVARVKGGAGIAGRVTSYLASILGWARRMGLLGHSPAEGVRVIPSRQRDRGFTDAELGRLAVALTEAERDGANTAHVTGLRLLALTGCRHNEIMALRWSEFDPAGFLRLQDSKTGSKVVPISAAATALLAAVPRCQGSPWVFPASRGAGPSRGLGKFWRAIRVRAGLPDDAVPHMLRHTVAQAAVSGGASPALLMVVLGHSDVRTSMRYVHTLLDPAVTVAEAASARVAAAMAAGTKPGLT